MPIFCYTFYKCVDWYFTASILRNLSEKIFLGLCEWVHKNFTSWNSYMLITRQPLKLLAARVEHLIWDRRGFDELLKPGTNILKSQVETRLLVTLSTHIGLHAGMVLAGNLRDFYLRAGSKVSKLALAYVNKRILALLKFPLITNCAVSKFLRKPPQIA